MFTDLPETLGFDAAPVWWPLPLLAVGGLLVRARDPLPPGHRRPLARRRLQDRGAAAARSSSRASCSPRWPRSRFGVVLGPEAPLIVIGSGLGVLAVQPRGARRAADRGRGDRARPAASRRSARCSARRCSARSCCWRRPGSAARCSASCCCPGLLAAGHRHADLPRAGLAHRPRHVLARDPRAARRSTTRRSRSSARRSSSGWSRRSSAAASRCSRSRCARASSRGWCC